MSRRGRGRDEFKLVLNVKGGATFQFSVGQKGWDRSKDRESKFAKDNADKDKAR